jgi:hypothetical protein
MLTTSFGKPFTSKDFSNIMADKIGDAGLPETVRDPRLAQGCLTPPG